jgi:hypothetical protein
MVTPSITLGQLAFACYLFDAMAGYDESFHEFRGEVGDELDLSDPKSGLALLHWLNHWGCRHLATHCHDMGAAALAGWFAEFQTQLPGAQARLVSVPDEELDLVAGVFDCLSGLVVARRRTFPDEQPVSLAPTATAKTLFALRPHMFVPWDVAMRKAFGHDGSGKSYVAYLKEVRAKLRDIDKQCELLPIALDALPARLGRRQSTAAQLIDEYHWITVTRGVEPPDADILREWVSWS